MSEKRKKFYITTPIYYVNDKPHLGHSYTSIIADVLARHHRLLDKEVFFLTGTDEHGTKVVKAAEKAGKNPKEFVNEISTEFKKLNQILNVSNNDFIRTTDKKRHWPTVKKIWLKLKEKGVLYKKKYKGLYCIGCEAFITKKDLKNGKCISHQKEPEIIEEENYFFKLSKYAKKLEKIIQKNEIKIIPQTRKNEVLSFIKQGLEDISFSRPREDLKWAIPVPDDSSASIYVWTDALSNYISALGYAENGDKFKKFWPADVHCVGKDILKFHSIIWTGMLLSLKLPLPKTVFIHGHITIAGQKMSKSLGNVVDPFELVKKYGTDAVRYFLLREISPTEDGDFTYQKFEQRYNADLANGLGNLVARVITMMEKFNPPAGGQNLKFKTKINKTQKAYKKALNEFKFNEALIVIWELIGWCDKYIEQQKPWELLSQVQSSNLKDQKLKEILSNLLFAIDNIAEMLKPFLPETSEKIIKQLKTKKSKPLFPRI